jgi:hypothetical protein
VGPKQIGRNRETTRREVKEYKNKKKIIHRGIFQMSNQKKGNYLDKSK